MMLSVECMFYKTLLVQLSKAGLGLFVPSGAHKWVFTAFPAIMTVTPPVPLSGFL
jgi:short subunit fatty acids transporter